MCTFKNINCVNWAHSALAPGKLRLVHTHACTHRHVHTFSRRIFEMGHILGVTVGCWNCAQRNLLFVFCPLVLPLALGRWG